MYVGTIFTFTGIYTGFTLTPEVTVSPIRMKLAVKDSLYLFSPMKAVAFRLVSSTIRVLGLINALKNILWP